MAKILKKKSNGLAASGLAFVCCFVFFFNLSVIELNFSVRKKGVGGE